MLTKILRKLSRDEQGATAVEYGLICAMIIIVMLVALQGVADSTITLWIDVATKTMAASE